MRPLVFIGPRGSGKDTAYEILKKAKIAHEKLAFAEPLKTICSEVFDVPLQLLNDPAFKETKLKDPKTINIKHLRAIREKLSEFVDPYEIYYNLNRIPQSHIGVVLDTPRKMLQYIGTNLIREVFSNWHCEAVFSKKNLSRAKYTRQKNQVICITDCRFENEFDIVARKYPNAKFFYVERPEAEENLQKAAHESETNVIALKNRIIELGGESAVLKNDGTLEDFTKLLKKTITKDFLKEMTKAAPLEDGQLEAGSKFRWAKR